jgi:hypothetical protein
MIASTRRCQNDYYQSKRLEVLLYEALSGAHRCCTRTAHSVTGCVAGVTHSCYCHLLAALALASALLLMETRCRQCRRHELDPHHPEQRFYTG